MNIINPNEIGTKISTLLLEAESIFIIVSPYIKIGEWKKMLVNLDRSLKRGVKIDCYYREVNPPDLKILKDLGINLFKVDGLHAKLYFNNNQVIVTSMNLYEYSDVNSIEIGMIYEELEEYNKLLNYFEKYIKSNVQVLSIVKETISITKDIYKDDLDLLKEKLEAQYRVKINRTKNYIFCNNLSTVFDFFFHQEEIGLKVKDRKVDQKQIKRINKALSKLEDVEYFLCEPTEKYAFHVYNVEYKITDYKFVFWFIDFINQEMEESKNKKSLFPGSWFS